MKNFFSRLSLACRAVAVWVGGSIVFATHEALACPFCYGAKDGKSTQHMAIAIWVLFGAVLSVMGGIGAFSFHLWRHGRMPVEPHQEITEEDLSKYE